jgi:hypothetical protein
MPERVAAGSAGGMSRKINRRGSVAAAKSFMVFLLKGYLEKLSFRPISALCAKFYPRNIMYMPAVKF